MEREFRFHAERRWRADFAHLESRTLIEIEGGVWVNGRHNRAAGFNADLEKYLEAGLLGWRVFRFGPDQITRENVARLVTMLQAPGLAAFQASLPSLASVSSEIPQ